jgi:putative CocE/NonD family hydrolase
LLPWRDVADDGVRTLDWIVAQPWSNGRVGTFGCSALGETQFVLARKNHPAHRAMTASGAGGAAGTVGGRYGYFGLFEGGVIQLASGLGWFVTHGAKDPRSPVAAHFDTAQHLRELPVSSLVQRARPQANGYSDFLSTPLGDASWESWGYWSDRDRSGVPVLSINTWGDQTLGEALALAEAWRAGGASQRVVIGPGNHCEHDALVVNSVRSRFGDLVWDGTGGIAWQETYIRWFRHWLTRGGIQSGRLSGPVHLLHAR